jgi:signal transduction histidine kinase
VSLISSNLKTTLSKNSLYLLAVLILTGGIYGICDYYLQSVAKELMQNWADTEAISIQEGNLLTSITKTQRFLISSSYVKGVKLVKIENRGIESKIEFGRPFDISADDLENLETGINQERIGFLHQRAFYPIPQKNGFILVFDVTSNFLILLFGISSGLIVFLVIYLILSLQRIEQKESQKREQILKLAINELLANGESSKVLEIEIPGLIRWWTVKRNELIESRKIAIEQQSKALLGELAAKAVHDIRGALRNIREVSKKSDGLNEIQKKIIQNSIEKISIISNDLLSGTKDINSEEASLNVKIDVVAVLKEIIERKKLDFQSTVDINLKSSLESGFAVLNPDQLARSIENLIDNSVDASDSAAKISIEIESSGKIAIIRITDFGKGISKENLQRFGSKGFTYGKTEGNGLGVYYAKRFVEDLGGRFDVQSEVGSGTSVFLSLPLTEITSRHSITIDPKQHLLILEDQPLIQKTIQLKFKEAGVAPSVYTIFSTPGELEEWIVTNKADFKLYSDYFLETEKGEKLESGVQVIKRLGLAKKSILFTSAFDNSEVINAANNIGLQVISKDQFFEANLVHY